MDVVDFAHSTLQCSISSFCFPPNFPLLLYFPPFLYNQGCEKWRRHTRDTYKTDLGRCPPYQSAPWGDRFPLVSWMGWCWPQELIVQGVAWLDGHSNGNELSASTWLGPHFMPRLISWKEGHANTQSSYWGTFSDDKKCDEITKSKSRLFRLLLDHYILQRAHSLQVLWDPKAFSAGHDDFHRIYCANDISNAAFPNYILIINISWLNFG